MFVFPQDSNLFKNFKFSEEKDIDKNKTYDVRCLTT